MTSPKPLFKTLFLLFVFVLLSALSLTSPLSGEERPDEDLIQARTKEVANTLRCAVCQSESVWESNAELAIQMRDIIRERLIAGESPDEIRAYFVSRYGDFIILKPRPFGLNWLLWVGPFLMLAVGAGLLYRSLRKWVYQTASVPHEEAPPINEEEQNKIQKELNHFKN